MTETHTQPRVVSQASRRHGARRLGWVGVTVGLIAALAAGGATAEDGTSPIGTWKTAESEGRYLHVAIAPCADDGIASDATLCGTVVGAFGGASEASVGRQLLWDMTPDGPARWSGGRVWAPDDDKTYRGKMALEAPDTLALSGCILGGLVCRGQDWTRLD